MGHTNYITEHKKGQHLTNEERHEIEVRRKDGWSTYKIAQHLSRPFNTIKNEISRGIVTLYNGKVKRYKADAGEEEYQRRRQNSRRRYRCLESAGFLKYTMTHFQEDGWSLDACFGRAMSDQVFAREQMVCTKTLYRYVELGLLPIKSIDLPEKLRRSEKQHHIRENRKKLGASIEERPENIDNRSEFGHWEIDSVLGKKSEKEPAVLVLTERKLRESIWLKVADHSADSVDDALKQLFDSYGDKWHEVFKSITADNGSEFANLSGLAEKGLPVFFTHPYTSCEKGTVEIHNRMLRRFIPKGKSISDYSAEDILIFADTINGLPRKILGYRTPDELFEAELERIYSVA